jgi:hypothetical protein
VKFFADPCKFDEKIHVNSTKIFMHTKKEQTLADLGSAGQRWSTRTTGARAEEGVRRAHPCRPSGGPQRHEWGRARGGRVRAGQREDHDDVRRPRPCRPAGGPRRREADASMPAGERTPTTSDGGRRSSRQWQLLEQGDGGGTSSGGLF